MLLEHGWTKTNNVDIIPPPFNDHLTGRRHEKEGNANLKYKNLELHLGWIQSHVVTTKFKGTSTLVAHSP
jgi:hypothetical protein